ncbi:hypothetical protein ACG3SL_01015 [Sphingomonas sp. CJ20]
MTLARMPKPIRLVLALMALFLVNCGGGNVARQTPLSENFALAESIEKQVSVAHPDFTPERYVRLYSHTEEGNVDGTYLFEKTGGLPSKWKAGQSYWVAPGDVPPVMDGGCAVIRVRYNVPSKTLVSVSCNGDA